MRNIFVGYCKFSNLLSSENSESIYCLSFIAFLLSICSIFTYLHLLKSLYMYDIFICVYMTIFRTYLYPKSFDRISFENIQR